MEAHCWLRERIKVGVVFDVFLRHVTVKRLSSSLIIKLHACRAQVEKSFTRNRQFVSGYNVKTVGMAPVIAPVFRLQAMAACGRARERRLFHEAHPPKP